MATTASPDTPTPKESEDLGRIVALTDGVIAIAITLLVLDIAVPMIPDGMVDDELPGALWDLRTEVFGFVLSFAVIGYYWLLHRLVFSHLRRGDLRLTVINLFFLLMIVFIPFVAALFSDYAPNGLAVASYAFVLALAGLSQVALFIYPKQKGHFHPSVSLDRISLTTQKVAVAPLVFILTIPIAFLNGWVAIGLWALIPVGRAVIARRRT